MSEDRTRNQNDLDVISSIESLKSTLETWARSHDLWYDCGFARHIDHVDAEPDPQPVALIMSYEGPLVQILYNQVDTDLYNEFDELVTSCGFEFEARDHVSTEFRPPAEQDYSKYFDFFHWQWLCSLIVPDCADVHEELYSHFKTRPEDLYKLHWREFETLLFRVFQNHGFEAQLGPGRGDEGVDIRILHRDPLGDFLTLVQAKKYAPHRKIDLQAVQALYGAAAYEGAANSIFVTTSDYQPVARRWASRTSGSIHLANSQEVQKWCRTATETVITDKSKLVTKENVSKLLLETRGGDFSNVVHANSGYGMISNEFALVIKETNHAALLMDLGRIMLSHDGHEQKGFEVPRLDETSLSNHGVDTVWRAKIKTSDSDVTYWDGKNLYSKWTGKQIHFDSCD